MPRGPKVITPANGRRQPGGGSVDWSRARPPADLGEFGAAHWRRLVDTLRAAGVLNRTAPAVVEMASRAYDLYRRAHVEMATMPLMVQANNGIPMKNPMVEVADRQTKILESLYARMGLTPATARHAATSSTQEAGADKWADVLGLHVG